MLIGTVATLVLALVAGLLTWRLSSRTPAPYAAPFLDATAVVAMAPELHYDTTIRGVGVLDAQVTSYGDMVGTVMQDGQSFGLLRVGGVVYLKPPRSGLPGVSNPAESAALDGKWLTGGDVTSVLGTLPDQLRSPPQLARQLFGALEDGTAVFPAVGAAPIQLDGMSVLAARTSLGKLYVTAAAPYRLVSLAPAATTSSTTGQPAALGARLAAAFAPADALPQAVLADTPGAPADDTMSFQPQQPGDVENTYDSLKTDAGQLADAVNSDLNFQLQGNGNLSCSSGGCQVTVTVTNTVTAGSGAITSGTVGADLTATIEVEGEPAAGCSGTGSLPINGSGQVGCFDAAAGPVFSAVDAQKKAQAEAQSRAEGGAAVPYQVNFTGEYYVYAIARVNVAQLVSQVQQQDTGDEQLGACAPGGDSFPADTRVLMPGGTLPIQDVPAGGTVLSAVPGTGALRPEPVTATILTRTDHAFARIGVTDPGTGTSGTFTVTSGHLIYSASTGLWTQARMLRPGDRLQTVAGKTAVVATVTPYTATAVTYNLAIGIIHTYYVEAGSTPVLVHNASCPPGIDLEKLSKAGTAPAPNGLTRAGYAYQKHMGRGQLPQVPGSQLNATGQNLLDEILTDPAADFQPVTSGNFTGGLRVVGTSIVTGWQGPAQGGDYFVNATFDFLGNLMYFGLSR